MSTEAPVPIAGRIICMGISLLSTTALTLFLSRSLFRILCAALESCYTLANGKL